jgi:hypothetical protein
MLNILLNFSESEKYFRKIWSGNQTTYFVFNNIFFPENYAVYEVMWKNIVEPDRPQMTIWSMRNKCQIVKAIDIHSKYVVLVAFPRQQ